MATINKKLTVKKSIPNYTVRIDPTNFTTFGAYNFSGALLLKYSAYCFQNKLDRNDVINQTKFLLREMNHNPELYGKSFKSAETIEKAAKIFYQNIIKSESSLSRTIDLAYEYMDRNNT
jgi:hypothetical protein